jgi:uncharacterized protein YvpB
MMLDYVNRVKVTEPTHALDEDRISEIIRTGISGTHFRDIQLINKEITSSNPSIEFEPEYSPHTLADIRKELEDGLPVMVWIVTTHGLNDYVHSVVVTGIDDKLKEISYNDPTYGTEHTVSQSEFLSQWQPPGAKMVKTKIGRLPRKTLDEFLREETINE